MAVLAGLQPGPDEFLGAAGTAVIATEWVDIRGVDEGDTVSDGGVEDGV